MYYPIIDKLKEVMAVIKSVKEKEPLVIEGTVTSMTGGTWVGNWSDIVSAFQNNKPVYFKIQISDSTMIVPVIDVGVGNANSSILYFNNMMVYGSLSQYGTFNLDPVQ